MELIIRGSITAETTKIDKNGDRETVWQTHSDLSVDEAAALQQVMGRELWIRLETSETYKARQAERAGQLAMALDGAPGITDQDYVEQERREEIEAEFLAPAEPVCANCGYPATEHPPYKHGESRCPAFVQEGDILTVEQEPGKEAAA